MSRNKEEKDKDQLIHENKVNKKPPIWVYLKTKDRGKMRERKRHWRRKSPVGKKIKDRKRKEENG